MSKAHDTNEMVDILAMVQHPDLHVPWYKSRSFGFSKVLMAVN